MINVKYGTEPIHDIMKEVPCAVVANQSALASETIFNTVPTIIFYQCIAAGIGVVCLESFLTFTRLPNGDTLYLDEAIKVILALILEQIGMAVLIGAIGEVFTDFDYKNSVDNFDRVCKKHTSPKIFPKFVGGAVILVLDTIIDACLIQTDKKI
jgi:hypothetical protein